LNAVVLAVCGVHPIRAELELQLDSSVGPGGDLAIIANVLKELGGTE
jgi:hypothetical protein